MFGKVFYFLLESIQRAREELGSASAGCAPHDKVRHGAAGGGSSVFLFFSHDPRRIDLLKPWYFQSQLGEIATGFLVVNLSCTLEIGRASPVGIEA